MSEGEHRVDKLSCGKTENKLVKNNRSSVQLHGLIKLGSGFSHTTFSGTRHPLLSNATATFPPYENHDPKKFEFIIGH
jgi:hypothetical protein